jgi:hypothetical protein
MAMLVKVPAGFLPKSQGVRKKKARLGETAGGSGGFASGLSGVVLPAFIPSGA